MEAKEKKISKRTQQRHCDICDQKFDAHTIVHERPRTGFYYLETIEGRRFYYLYCPIAEK